jgi:hypothetical protein
VNDFFFFFFFEKNEVNSMMECEGMCSGIWGEYKGCLTNKAYFLFPYEDIFHNSFPYIYFPISLKYFFFTKYKFSTYPHFFSQNFNTILN